MRKDFSSENIIMIYCIMIIRTLSGGDILKKTVFLLLLAVIMLFFASCAQTPDMMGLLSYQSADFSAVLRADDGREYTVGRSGGKTEVSVGGAVYVPTENGATLMLCGMKTELATLPPSIVTAIAVFSFDTESTWKIERSTVGGADVYICRSEEGSVYIEAGSLLPCRAEKDGKIFDITSFEVIKKAPAE
jgi:hypothetical protein